MIIPLDKQQAEKIKELHEKQIEAILRTKNDLENKIKSVLEEINTYNKELGI